MGATSRIENGRIRIDCPVTDMPFWIALGPVGAAVVAGTWILLGGPPAVILGGLTVLPAAIALAILHLFQTRFQRRVCTLDESSFTLVPLRAGRLSRKPVHFEWNQVGAATVWRRFLRKGVRLFVHEAPPGERVFRIDVPPWASGKPELRAHIRRHVEAFRLDKDIPATETGMQAERRPVITQRLATIIACGLVIVVSADMARSIINDSLHEGMGSPSRSVLPVFLLPTATAVLAALLLSWRRSSTRALMAGSVMALYALMLISEVANKLCNISPQYPMAFSAALASFLLCCLVVAEWDLGPWGWRRVTAAYALSVAGFCAGWSWDQGIPVVRVPGSQWGATWTPRGDAFVLWHCSVNECHRQTREEQPPDESACVGWFAANGAPMRRVNLHEPVEWIAFSGDKAALVSTMAASTKESQVPPWTCNLWYVPRFSGPAAKIATMDIRGGPCQRLRYSPDGRWCVYSWERDKELYWTRCDMGSGGVNEVKTPQPMTFLGVSNDGGYIGLSFERTVRGRNEDVIAYCGPKLWKWEEGLPPAIVYSSGDEWRQVYPAADFTSVYFQAERDSFSARSSNWRIETSANVPAITSIEETPYCATQAWEHQSHSAGTLRRSIVSQTYIFDHCTRRRFPLRGVATTIQTAEWSPTQHKMLLTSWRYDCRFAQRHWWACFAVEEWVLPETVLVDLDAPEARKMMGVEKQGS